MGSPMPGCGGGRGAEGLGDREGELLELLAEGRGRHLPGQSLAPVELLQTKLSTGTSLNKSGKWS